MGRSEKRVRREQFCTGFQRIVILFAQELGRKWAAFPLFAADLVKSDRLLTRIKAGSNTGGQGIRHQGLASGIA